MKSKGVLILIAVLLALILCAQLYGIKMGESSRDIMEHEDYAGRDEFYEEDFLFTIPEVNFMRLDTAIRLETHKDDLVSLGAANSAPSTVFARISTSGCPSCSSTLLRNLHRLKREVPTANIVVLIKNITGHDLYVNTIEHGRAFEMLKVQDFPLDSIILNDSPYIFLINEGGNIASHFICNYGDTTYIRKYVDGLTELKR